MSKVVTTTLLPDVAGGSVTLGGTGDSVVVTGNDIRANVLQDAGGNAVLTSNGSGVLSGVNSGLGGAFNLLSTQTASGAASLSFTTQLTSTYDVYIFKFIDMNPAANGDGLTVNFSSDGGSNYNMTKTSTAFTVSHYENNSDASMGYASGDDLAQSTAFQYLTSAGGSGADESAAGELHLYAPASTTYVKHFYSRLNLYTYVAMSREMYVGGYVNSTSAVNAVQFKFNSGLMDGTIKLYGISKS